MSEASKTTPSARRVVRGEVVDDQAMRWQTQLKSLAWLLDEAITIPGTQLSIGLDSLIGLIPGVGDVLSAGMSTYLIRIAAKLGVPKVLLFQMACNTFIDTVVGAIPFLGDIFDIGFKANKRNVKLVLDYLDQPADTLKKSRVAIAKLVVVSLAAIALLFGGCWWLVYLLSSPASGQ